MIAHHLPLEMSTRVSHFQDRADNMRLVRGANASERVANPDRENCRVEVTIDKIVTP